MTEITNTWIETFTGVMFRPLDPRPRDIKIEDIAHALSNLCRYAGHTKEFYSVAQHSILVAEQCPDDCKLWGLLHDAAEAYIADLPRPVKRCLPDYKVIEEELLRTVAARFRLPYPIPQVVLDIDTKMLKIEHRDVMVRHGNEWSCDNLATLPVKIDECLHPGLAKILFLGAFYRYKALNARKEIGYVKDRKRDRIRSGW